MAGTIAIPIDSTIVGELFDRLGPEADIAGTVEGVVLTWMEATEWYDDMWRSEWLERRDERHDERLEEEFGPAHLGYQWGPVLLRNGTRLRMTYQGREHEANVKHGTIQYEGETYSPSQLASKIAGNTARNAWRDLTVQPPGQAWIKADELRRKTKSASHSEAR
jgi:hypothetical protein